MEQSREDEARRLGWTSQEEWVESGKDPERWRDADEFLKYGEERLPIMKENYDKLTNKYEQLEASLSSERAEREKLMKMIGALKNTTEQAIQREYDRALNDLKHKRNTAMVEGDTAEFSRMDDEIDKLREQKAKAEQETKAEPTSQTQIPPVIQKKMDNWQAENAWYGQNPEMTIFVDNMARALGQRGFQMESDRFWVELDSTIRKQFPEAFENKARQAPAAVGTDGGNLDSGEVKKSGKKDYRSLPAWAKQACDQMVNEGVLSKEEYVKTFFESQGA